jgi:hypothetical protein
VKLFPIFFFGMGVALASACSATDDGALKGGGGGQGGDSAASGAGGIAAGPGSGGGGGIVIVDDGGGTGGVTLEDGGECAAEDYVGEQLPVDLYIMLDRSGSMTEKTAAGATKWDSVVTALKGFFGDDKSTGLGVGIQYFPLLKDGVPDSCATNTDCGAGGPCVTRLCFNGLLGFANPCTRNSDCGFLFSCTDIGYCANDPSYTCGPAGGNCGSGLGSCVKGGFCSGKFSCDVTDYSTPAVPIAPLPGNAGALTSSIDSIDPTGNTPTSAALRGAIERAKAHAQENPDHRVAIVFATDGLPTSCAPTDINQIGQIANQAYQGSPSIQTFVIGVFAPGEASAQQNLNTIAQNGGTGTAFMVDASGNVSQQFQAALDKIRGATLSCDFQLPKPEAGTVDFGKVNVDVKSDVGTSKLYYTGGADKCDPQQGGWYYDVDPAAGTPTRIIVCPATCSAFESTPGLTVKILLGCETKPLPPT